MEYNHREIEKKWQKFWDEHGSYRTGDASGAPKFYAVDMFPYPSGLGLHVGHFKGYVATDIIARMKRAQGFNVMHPMGWDAFGLPAENYALKTGIHPEITTRKNIDNIRRQMKDVGLSYDWEREINTTDPDYYKWTQWIFLKLFEHGLAYKKMLPINWCPSCKTGLANEEVVDGRCERCGTETTKKDVEQWVLRITNYADRLLSDLDLIDWPEKIKEMQKNWIGRSEGWEIKFSIKDSPEEISVFTTRADTLFGCTYAVIAPEHPLIEKIRSRIDNYEEISGYIKKAKNKSERERVSEVKDKTGVEIKGLKAINPVNGQEVPVFVADYVLAHYGTGAVMAVPAHDERDFEFAEKYGLPIIYVVQGGEEGKAFTGDGVLFNSQEFDGSTSVEAREKIGEYLKKKGRAEKKINYKLRDWVFSRQRYWGEPIPIIHCPHCGMVPVPEAELPLRLPYIEKYQPTGTGESPLAAISEWVNVKCPHCGEMAKRETNTMPQWAGSCWYYLRYIDPKNDKELVDKGKEKQWMPVDLYVGGAEHAVLHLLYSRFWHKFLYDIGAVSGKEPFYKLRNIGLVLATDGQKMSKSKGNVVSSDEIIEEFGADTLRVYEMFMGPFDQAIQWNTQGVKGVYRFLNKLWDLVLECKGNGESSPEVVSYVHKLNKKVTNDLEKMKFNTPIAFFMEFVNFISDKKSGLGIKEIERLLVMLSPFAPHLSEELWKLSGHGESILNAKWPEPDEEFIKEEMVAIVVQVDGKLRDKIDAPADVSKEEALALAMQSDKVKKWTNSKKIKEVFFVPNKLMNILTD